MALRLDYRCLLDAFEDYYYHKEIQRLVAETAGGATATSPASSASSASSTASISSASCSSGPSTSSIVSSAASSHGSLAQVATARAAAALADQQALASQRAMFYNVQHPQQLEQLHALQAESGNQQMHPQANADPNASSMANSLLWQPWRDLQQAAAMHHQLYRQQQQQLQLHSGSFVRATSKKSTSENPPTD